MEPCNETIFIMAKFTQRKKNISDVFNRMRRMIREKMHAEMRRMLKRLDLQIEIPRSEKDQNLKILGLALSSELDAKLLMDSNFRLGTEYENVAFESIVTIIIRQSDISCDPYVVVLNMLMNIEDLSVFNATLEALCEFAREYTLLSGILF